MSEVCSRSNNSSGVPARSCRSRRTIGRPGSMPTVTVEGEKSFEVEAGKKLVLAIEDAGIDVMHRCGGNARRTTRRGELIAGAPAPMKELEHPRLPGEASLGPDIRLSCQIRVESDLTVNVLGRASLSG